MLTVPLTKILQQRKTARHCKTPMKSIIVSIGSRTRFARKQRLLVVALYVSEIS